MKTFLRACVTLGSFVFASALFASSDVDIDVASGQVLEVQLGGTTNVDLVVTKLGSGGGVVATLSATPDNYGSGWAYNYYYSASVYQSGASFQANPYSPYYSNYRGVLSGLAAGTYRVTCSAVGGNLPEYYRSQNGSTYYISQGDNSYNEWVDYSFEAY